MPPADGLTGDAHIDTEDLLVVGPPLVLHLVPRMPFTQALHVLEEPALEVDRILPKDQGLDVVEDDGLDEPSRRPQPAIEVEGARSSPSGWRKR